LDKEIPTNFGSHLDQSWKSSVLSECSSTQTAAAGTFLRFFQMIFENTSLWRLKR